MDLSPSRRLRSGIKFFAFFCSISFAAANVCYDDPAFHAFNATASQSVAGFVYGDFHASPNNNTLSISTAIRNQYIPGFNHSQVLQSFWFDSQPVIDTNLTGRPYWGCMVALEGLPTTPVSVDNHPPNGCDGLFSNDCFRMIEYFANLAVSMSGRDTGDVSLVCKVIADYISNPAPDMCKNSQNWRTRFATPVFGNVGDVGNDCDTGVFNGSANYASVFTAASNFSDPTDFTTYDQWVRRSTPVIVTAFSKDVSHDLWVDTRLVCLNASTTIEQGSRVPASDASRGQKLSFGISWILGIASLLLIC